MYLKNFLIILVLIPIFSSLATQPVLVMEPTIQSTNVAITFDGGDFYWTSWSLHSSNKNLNVFINGFKDEEKRKSLASALHMLYARLSHNVFDVSVLEDALLDEFEYTSLPCPQGTNFCKSILSINGQEVQEIVIANQISSNLEAQGFGKIISLGVNSKILQRLSSSGADKYKKNLLDLSKTLLSPLFEKGTQTRPIFLIIFASNLLNLSQKYGWNAKHKKKSDEEIIEEPLQRLTSKPMNRWLSIGAFVGGLSLGLNVGFAANYFLKNYLNNNPKYAVSLLAMTSLLGGLGGCALVKFLK
jgi:hypothetical protein